MKKVEIPLRKIKRVTCDGCILNVFLQNKSVYQATEIEVNPLEETALILTHNDLPVFVPEVPETNV